MVVGIGQRVHARYGFVVCISDEAIRNRPKWEGKQKMNRNIIVLLITIGVLVGCLAPRPAVALKVYLNPSIQTGNYSPDGTYQEGSNMQDVASKLLNKLQNRGFEARSSGWLDLGPACSDANSWGANCFVGIHTDSTGAGGWTSAHGTRGFFHQNSAGWHDDRNIDFAGHIAGKMAEKFNNDNWGRGYNLGTQADYPWCGWNMYVIAPWNTNALPATLIEGLYHDNYDDVQLLKTDLGRDAYARGIFEGVCDYYGWNYSNPSQWWNSPTCQSGGKVLVFARATNGHVMMCSQTATNSSTWTAWTDLGGSMQGRVRLSVNSDGRVEIFARGTDNALWHNWQTTPAGSTWNGWVSLGGTLAGSPSVKRNLGGRIAAYVVFSDGAAHHIWENSANSSTSYSSWALVGGSNLTGDACTAINEDGRLEVYARGVSNNIYQNWQNVADSGWNATGNPALGGSLIPGSSPDVVSNQDDRLEVHVRGTDGKMYMCYHNWSGWSWTGWGSMGGPGCGLTGNPSSIHNADGRLEIFSVGADHAVWKNFQNTKPGGGWYGWYSHGLTDATGDVVLAREPDGKLIVFVLKTDGTCYKMRQSVAGQSWEAWGNIGGSGLAAL